MTSSRHTIEEAVTILESTPISRLVPPSYEQWEDDKGRVCPIRLLAHVWGIPDDEVLLKLGASLDLNDPTIVYDRSPSRKQGVRRVVAWLQECAR